MTIIEILHQRNNNKTKIECLDTIIDNLTYSLNDKALIVTIRTADTKSDDINFSSANDVCTILTNIIADYQEQVKTADEIIERLDITNIQKDECGDLQSCDISVIKPVDGGSDD